MSNNNVVVGLERRREDHALITGRANYVDDLRSPAGRPSALHMIVVRSMYAHAEIKDIRFDEALDQPGVIGAFTSAELVGELPTIESLPMPGLSQPERHLLAIGQARYVGDPLAVVLAEDQYIAEDALELVEVDYEPLSAVTDPEAALAPDAPLLYKDFGTNRAFISQTGGGDIAAAFEQADRTIRLRLVNQRLAPSSMEPRACMFDFDPESGQLSAWVSSQSLSRVRNTLARFLNMDRSKIRVYNAEVGGGFGAKTTFLGEEIVAALLAVKYGRPVKWIETRSENLQAQIHGRGQINYIEAAIKNDGQLLGFKLRTVADLGAFLAGMTAGIAIGTTYLLNGPYRLQALDCQVVGAFTNKVPTAAYRGAGRPEATYILERIMDRIAHELDLDPVAVRQRNFIPADAFPFKTLTGFEYESGNYQIGLKRLLELSDYAGWRVKQQEQRQQGSSQQPLIGLGLATFIENSGGGMGPVGPNIPQESATVRIRRDGTVLVQSGVATNGQGHFTAFAQIVAMALHVPAVQVEVQMNDSGLPAFSFGTFGSRITQTTGSAILLAAEAVRDKALQVAAHMLEATTDDLIMEDCKVMVQGVPARAVTFGELARLVEEQPDLIEHESPNPSNGVPIEGLTAWRDFVSPQATYSSGAHLAVVEVDPDTGDVHILTYVAVDDLGHVLNNYLAEAQIHGGLAQGIGQALYEEVMYDQEGQILTATLMDYALPIAAYVPHIVSDFVETPSSRNPLGVKGVGEAGTIAAPPAIVNAVLDALAPLGIKSIDMALTPGKIWTLVQAAQQGTLDQSDPPVPAFFGSASKSQKGDDDPVFE
jgi:carbon-monoxide dehydrogenase large subunit